jgi:UDP-3-O-[3-hydroxymyristoyl] glucosamine N-acyltransferase
MTAREVAARLGGRCVGDGERSLSGMAAAGDGGPESLTFASDERNAALVRASRAGAALVREGLDVSPAVAVVVPDPRAAAAKAALMFRPPPAAAPGRHPTAVVAADAVVPASCTVGPFAVVGAGARLGERVRVGAHAVVGEDCEIGEGTVIHPHVVLYARVKVGRDGEIHAGAVLGRPGFGYDPTPQGPVLFPQTGDVVLGDRVDVGANATIDRATFGSTRVEDSAKIDNLVQVAHNVRIGKAAIVCAQTGISGSSVIGERVILGGQVGIANRVEIRPGTIVGAQGGVGDGAKLGGEGEVWSGTLARPHADWVRGQAMVQRLVRADRGRAGSRKSSP